MQDNKAKIIAAALLALGLALAGYAVKCGIDNFAGKDRRITVKGLAEREVKANKVTWPIVTTEIGNDVQQLYADINRKNDIVVAFLKSHGLTAAEISVNAPVVNDRNAQNYNYESAAVRYNVQSVITVTSAQVDKVRGIMARQSELLRQGVAVVKDYDQRVVYEYTGFKVIKPKMMDEAVESARTTAEQFAGKCGCRLDRLETASQGVFSIEDRDANTPYIKQLRVVTTVAYSLKN